MRKIRIGKDINVRWHIEVPEGSEPLSDMDLTLYMSGPQGMHVLIENATIGVDTIEFTLRGTDFNYLGDYSLTCWKNKGEQGQTVLDAVRAFTLVKSSDQEADYHECGCNDLELATVDLRTELQIDFLGYFNDPAIIARLDDLTARVEALEHEDPPTPPTPTPTYSVTRNLTGVNSSNSTNSVTEGGSYTTTLSLASGYQNMSVTVTMGGTNITSSALNGNVITIASVTGNVVITATATQIPVEVEYIYGGGAFSTASSISYSDLVIDTTVDASTKTITFGVDNQNHIGIIAPANLTLTSCLHIDAIPEDLTAEFASSAQAITYNGKSMKLYQVKSTAGKMYNTTFRANFS